MLPQEVDKSDREVACRGQRRGAVKHGVGAYKYPSGAAYDGEWVHNVKQGRGIFRFAKVGDLAQGLPKIAQARDSKS